MSAEVRKAFFPNTPGDSVRDDQMCLLTDRAHETYENKPLIFILTDRAHETYEIKDLVTSLIWSQNRLERDRATDLRRSSEDAPSKHFRRHDWSVTGMTELQHPRPHMPAGVIEHVLGMTEVSQGMTEVSTGMTGVS